MFRPGLYDGSFVGQHSASCGGENVGARPTCLEWTRGHDGEYSTWYTDMLLATVRAQKHGLRVAWLLEPAALHDTHYKRAIEMESEFDYILTHNLDLVERGEQWLYYPFGGSWIHPGDRMVYPDKPKRASLIASFKTGAEGHRLRHDIARLHGNALDLYGSGYKPIASKLDGLLDYRYTVTVENCRVDGYFTEKLLDAFLCGTVPIYWGGDVSDFFNPDGIITFGSLEELDIILASLTTSDYVRRLDAIKANFMAASEYIITEDWLCRRYPFLFQSCDGVG